MSKDLYRLLLWIFPASITLPVTCLAPATMSPVIAQPMSRGEAGELPERPLTLEAAVALALRRSPAAERARQEHAAALAVAQREAPRLAPSLSVAGAGLLNNPRINFPSDADGEATVVPRSRLRLEVTAATPLLHPGGAWAADRFRASTEAADASLDQTLADLRRDTEHAYFALLAAEAGVAVAQEGADQALAHRRLVDDLLTAGRATRLDQLQSDVEVEETAAAAEDAVEGRDLAAAALNRLLGLPLDQRVAAAGLREPGPLPDERQVVAAVERRPDLRALAAQATAAEAGAALARFQTAPAVDLAFGYALQTPSAFVARSSWTTSLTVTWPLGLRARARYDVREAAARAAAARVALAELRQAAALEVRQALHAMRSAQRRREGALRATAAAEEALRITVLRFQTGRATGQEVAAARATVNRTRLMAVRALSDWYTGLADLEHAYGGPLPNG